MRFSLCFAGLSVTAAQASAIPAPVAPTGKWVVEFADARCVATRDYGKEVLAIRASPMGDVVQFSMLAPGVVLAQQLNAELEPENGEKVRSTAVTWTLSKPSRRIMQTHLKLTDFDRLTGGTSLRIKAGTLSRTFALSDMPSLRRVLKRCVDDLQSTWGVASGGIASRATANMASYITDEDYPAVAFSNSWSGTTGFAMLIDEMGKVADCMITATSGQAILDAQACAIIRQRARFVPARDPQGKPSKDRATSSIRWKIGGSGEF